jgi:5-methylcytosine-specific restriction endonuclease McrA
MYRCPHCDKECTNKNSLAQHRSRCPENKDRTAVGFVKGGKSPTPNGNPASLIKYNEERLQPLDDVMIENSSYPRRSLKRRLLRYGILEYKCVLCDNNGSHNGQPLTLQLDHINGINNDHRLENVRLLCPNCHTQQDTYAGKNKPRKEKIVVTPSFFEEKLEKDKLTWNDIKSNSEIRFDEWGWRVRVAKLIGITPQNVNKWIDRVDPEFSKVIQNT